MNKISSSGRRKGAGRREVGRGFLELAANLRGLAAAAANWSVISI